MHFRLRRSRHIHSRLNRQSRQSRLLLPHSDQLLLPLPQSGQFQCQS